ncbi:MEDS domain-containing protein [Streptomyces sp. NBC_00454]|uniref:MEDS domain-containing protein n=1 Tax=Streptomyces sp. NBC_00454 TaxID=2975747 RepID=UPI0030E1E435
MTLAGRNPGRIIPGVPLSFADAHPSGHVRIIGEPIRPGRTPREYPACVQHEALINAAFHGRGVTALCPYDAERLPPRYSPTRAPPSRALAQSNDPLTHPGDAAAFEFDEGHLHGARFFATRIASRLGMAEEARAAPSLTVAELTTNSVVHGSGNETLRLWAERDQLVYEVRDPGLLRDPLAGRRLPRSSGREDADCS